LFGALLVLALMPSDGLGPSACPLHMLFGIPCPGCGLTRSVSSALHFEFIKSLQYHPLGIPALLAALALIMFRLPGHPIQLTQQGAKYRWTVPTVVALFLAVWLMRLCVSLLGGAPYFG